MNAMRYLLAALVAAAVAAGSVLLPRAGSPALAEADVATAGGNHVLAMFGGTPARNMVNLADKEFPTEWEVPKKEGDAGTNIKWVAKLGSRAYALTIAGNKVFVGTNNAAPRNKRDTR